MPGELPVNTLGRGWLPTPESRAMEPATINTSVITVPAINTNGLTRVSQNSQPRQISLHLPAHVLSFAPAARPILRPTRRISGSVTRTGETRPPGLVRLDACAVPGARVGGISADFLRSEA